MAAAAAAAAAAEVGCVFDENVVGVVVVVELFDECRSRRRMRWARIVAVEFLLLLG